MNILITGGSGNMGMAMSEYLLKNTKFNVFLGVRKLLNPSYTHPRLFRKNLDITDDSNINEVFQEIKPNYIINFAGFTQVGPSWNCPGVVYDVNCLGVMRLLEAIRKNDPKCRLFSAGTIMEYSDSGDIITEESIPCPNTIYGASKNAAHNLIKIYREKYGLFAVHGILGNNEGKHKTEDFAFKKIIAGITRNRKRYWDSEKNMETIVLGNLAAVRAWGDTDEFCDGIWKMINQDFINPKFEKIKDYIISKRFIEVSKDYYREEKSRVDACSDLIKKELGWQHKTKFHDLVKKLLDFEYSKI